ncbi:MAG: protein-tyrosine phosphatase [Verrucomicrobiales bacterium]|jgi:protein-tyrosine phosphatase
MGVEFTCVFKRMTAFAPRIFSVESIGRGSLAVMARPVAGEWIEEEFAGIAEAGINRVVSLLEIDEAIELGLGAEADLCRRNGMEFSSFPIRDRGLPQSLSNFAEFNREIYQAILSGTNIVVHCRAGIGRTGIFSAALLLRSGQNAEEAFKRISAARGLRVPDTEEQRAWVKANERALRS